MKTPKMDQRKYPMKVQEMPHNGAVFWKTVFSLYDKLKGEDLIPELAHLIYKSYCNIIIHDKSTPYR